MNSIIRPYAFLLSGAVIVTGVFYYAVTRPIIAERATAKLNAKQLETKLEEYQASVIMINEYLAARDSLADVRKRLNDGLYTSSDVLRLIEHIEKTALASGVEVREISPAVPDLLMLNAEIDPNKTPRDLSFSVRFAGSIRNAAKYLQALESESFYRGLNKLDVFERGSGVEPAEYVFHFRALVGTMGKSVFTKK